MPKNTYSCCRQPVGQPHGDHCPLFGVVQINRVCTCKHKPEDYPGTGLQHHAKCPMNPKNLKK